MRFITNLKLNEEKIKELNRVIVQDQFYEKIDAIRNLKLNLLKDPSLVGHSDPPEITSHSATLTQIEPDLVYDCDPQLGMNYAKEVIFSGYDESKAQFLALEGEAQLTTHVVTHFFRDNIIPACKISFYFYSQSKMLEKQSKYVKFSKEITSDSNVDYINDRNDIILTTALDGSILFVDGPLIGGNISSYNLKLVDSLLSKNVIPIFVVKNSDSNLVIDYTSSLKERYNSDLHWAYETLKMGQRSCLFRYTDQVNPTNSKIFCYIKPFNRVTTQRIEMSVDTYSAFFNDLNKLFGLVYYLILDHGSETNPQMRPIAISEQYAREILKLIDFERLLRNSTLVPIMNETRFGG